MKTSSHATAARCAITGAPITDFDRVTLNMVRPTVADRIRADHPDLPADAWISRRIVDEYRSRYITELLEAEHGELSQLDRAVASSIARHETIATDVEDEFASKRTFGERMADAVARFGGSWIFIFSFALVLVGWIALNLAMGAAASFDPYPFILLNLVLSCLAAVQAPIIMMSQKRQEAKDRLRAQSDYRVNLKAELEIRHLHEKIDHLLVRQWERLTEIQQLQIELLQEIREEEAGEESAGPADEARPETGNRRKRR